ENLASSTSPLLRRMERKSVVEEGALISDQGSECVGDRQMRVGATLEHDSAAMRKALACCSKKLLNSLWATSVVIAPTSKLRAGEGVSERTRAWASRRRIHVGYGMLARRSYRIRPIAHQARSPRFSPA